MKHPDRLLAQVEEVARKAGEIIQNAHPCTQDEMSKEGHANYVTRYDQEVQAYLNKELGAILPEAHFVGEENGQEVFLPEYEQGYTFVLDPIDGTSNFLKAYRPSVVSIALLFDGSPLLAVIHSPFTGELFSAIKGGGAFRNGEKISACLSPLSDSLVLMGTAPYYGPKMNRVAFEVAFNYLQRSIDIRRSGSAAFDLCSVALGRAGLFFEPVLGLWDYCAGALILEEAGGKITDMRGKPLAYRGKSSILAACAGVAKEEYLPDSALLPEEL